MFVMLVADMMAKKKSGKVVVVTYCVPVEEAYGNPDACMPDLAYDGYDFQVFHMEGNAWQWCEFLEVTQQ